MKKEEYRTLYHVEDRHWWYIGLRDLVHRIIKDRFFGRSDITLLDAGCGTGGFLASLKGIDGYGFDLFDEALEYCGIRGLKNVVKGSICEIPFKDEHFDIVVSTDVLCDLEEGRDMAALREMKRVLKKGGVLVLNLPAYDFLKGSHDKAVSNLKRYTKPEIEEKLLLEGMGIERISYRNTVLFPFILAKRLIEKILPQDNTGGASELFLSPPTLDFLLSRVLLMENCLMEYLDFPFGLSVFCVAEKNHHE